MDLVLFATASAMAYRLSALAVKKAENTTTTTPVKTTTNNRTKSFVSLSSLQDTASLTAGSLSDGNNSLLSTPNHHQDLRMTTSSTTTTSPPTRVVSIEHKPLIVILEAAGGTDKDPQTGHRRDTIPIRDALLETQQCDTIILQYQEEDDAHMLAEAAQQHNMTVQERAAWAAAQNQAIRNETLLRPHVAGVIVRVNPGTLSPATQAKLDALLVELDQQGRKILSHPKVQRNMGAKDALCKISHLKCGLEDTAAYYDAEAFAYGFRKSIAFRPRVIKQNRGSQGEGIWICKLKDESKYCAKFGDQIASLDTRLVLMEANDNHVEEHTVGEFIEFCVHGRTETSGHWDSLGRGKYLEGGVEAGAMIVDQRFLPRIVEGEVRCLMVGSELVELIHKKPKSGGLSATLQSGAVYTAYQPDDPAFGNLVQNFHDDLPHIMQAFGMSDQPLPLLWTADYIFGDKDAAGNDTFYIGEFNCTCVGITKGLDRASTVAATAIDIMLSA